MFRNANLKVAYSTSIGGCSIANDFYIPVFKEAVRFDRASGFFSARSLSLYSEGLLEFVSKPDSHYRLIVSAEISKEDYERIKNGYELREESNEAFIQKLRDVVSLRDEKNISNLAFLIATGKVDLKIAFNMNAGMFHSKYGYAEDLNGDKLSFGGSNNETPYGSEINDEQVDVNFSWGGSDSVQKIQNHKDLFERSWNNQLTNGTIVSDISNVFYEEIQGHNKGHLVYDEVELARDCCILDYKDNVFYLENKLEDDEIDLLHSGFFKVRMKAFCDLHLTTNKRIVFNTNSYIKMKKIMEQCKIWFGRLGKRLYCSRVLLEYLDKKELYIMKRARMANAIKSKHYSVLESFYNYKKYVNSVFSIRPLREQQMWDSFYMYCMQKCSNFSVPGAGKTASVLGTYAFLKKTNSVKRIVVIGPISAYLSWKNEYKACFGTDITPFTLFDFKNREQKKTALLFMSGSYEMVFINYEAVNRYVDEIKKLISTDSLLVFDEVHKVKNLHGKWAAAALEISKDSNYTIVMTGTPIPNKYTDIYNLLHILYEAEYGDYFSFSTNLLADPTPEEIRKINDRIRPFFCRTSKKQLGVPAPNEDILDIVDADNIENRLFQIILAKYFNNKFAFIIRLLQMESNPLMLLNKLDLSEFKDLFDYDADIKDDVVVDYQSDVKTLIDSFKHRNTSKFEACINQALDLYSQNKKFLIWTIFTDSIRHLQRELQLKGLRVAVIYGATNKGDGEDGRDHIITAFNEGKYDCLITNPHTLAESVSLHEVAHDAIYFEYSYNLVHMLQSKDRIHRLGLPEGQYTQYFFTMQTYVSPRNGLQYSLDKEIYDRLEHKADVMNIAIENDTLEIVTESDKDDVDFILKKLNLK